MFKPDPRHQNEILCPRYIQLKGALTAEALSAEVVIGICVRNQAKHLPAALASAMLQSVMHDGKGVVVILDDSSGDDWQTGVSSWLKDPRVVVVNALCGTAARARNALLDWIDGALPSARWVARLDADDRLSENNSLQALWHAGNEADALFVLGSNHLEAGGTMLERSNIADPAILLDKAHLLAFIDAFCHRKQEQELPSCNLLLRAGSGIRYPDVRSAEDHWLIARLLMLEAQRGVVVPHPVYAIYSLGGTTSELNRRSEQWSLQRHRLACAAKHWLQASNGPGDLLGVGQEGVVWRVGDRVFKRFFPWAMNASNVIALKKLVSGKIGLVPDVEWTQSEGDGWLCSYPWFDSAPVPLNVSIHSVRHYLQTMHQSGFVTSNIKRSNLRLDASGQLVFIDIGKDIVPFTPSRFLDAAARLYSIGVLGHSDHELARRMTSCRQHEALDNLPGFSGFYRSLIEELYPHCLIENYPEVTSTLGIDERVTLLIKCCGQDINYFEDQVRHIVSQLSYPRRFAKTILLIDPFEGPFLRHFAGADLQQLQVQAQRLLNEGILDEIWQAPGTPQDIRVTYSRWFGHSDIAASHTHAGAPLFSQLWAFDRVSTPYVLQCDIDILVGRRDQDHDYLADMLEAAGAVGVISVGFNISQPCHGFKAYQGELDQYAPEIRCGLINLDRIRAACPLPNTIINGRYELMWHRSSRKKQKETGTRSVRGGDSRTFYIHPMNVDKHNPKFSVWRDLVAQGIEPDDQKGLWDLSPNVNWDYPTRDEPLVFLLKGRDIPLAKIRRCLASLAMQVEQRFGVILIDDGSSISENWLLPLLLGKLKTRTTLIRQRDRQGHIRNFLTAVGKVCTNPDTLVVTLDLDDALMSSQVSLKLWKAMDDGADVVHGFMFRPDKPLQLYEPNYEDPRNAGGGNVWAHLRGFRKRLFDALPKHYLQYEQEWVDEVTDYALMLPLSELARHPVYIDDLFCYYHQRKPYSGTRKGKQRQILAALFSLPPAQWPNAVEPA